ncbi:MAG: hypothetical protein ACOXZV_00570 [Bacteroidales bacterium]|jgi:hypothetical protein
MKKFILKKHCRDERGNWIGLTEEGVLEAMSEYARQESGKYKELVEAYMEYEKCLDKAISKDDDIIEKYSLWLKIKAKIELLKIDLEL